MNLIKKQLKQIRKNIPKVCVICNQTIDELKSDYYRVEVFRRKMSGGIDYCHLICWQTKMNNEAKMSKLLEQVGVFVK